MKMGKSFVCIWPLFCFLLIGAASSCYGIEFPLFKTRTDYPVLGYANDVVIADLNEDGIGDFVVAYNDPDGIAVFIGRGNGAYEPAVTYAAGAKPFALGIADLDGDGNLDVAVANKDDSTVTILIGNADGTLRNGTTLETVPLPIKLKIADIGGDGYNDIVVMNGATGSSFCVHYGRPDGSYERVCAQTGTSARGLDVADMDEDGDLDIVTVGSNTPSFIHWHLYEPFDPEALLDLGRWYINGVADTEEGASAVVVYDFNKDGVMDVATGTSVEGGSVTIHFGEGDGFLSAGSSFPIGHGAEDMGVVDLNGDGKEDLVISYPGRVSVLLGEGDASFRYAARFITGTGLSALSIGDLNADGKPDLAMVNWGQYSPPFFKGSVSLMIGSGDGSFVKSSDYFVGDNASALAAGDLNEDGLLDLVVGNTDNNGAAIVSVLKNRGGAEFVDPINYFAGFAPSKPKGIAVGDLNEDGRPDLAVALRNGDLGTLDGSVTLLFGQQGGTFQSGLTYVCGKEPNSIASGDLNNDGHIDLAVATQKGVSILIGKGDGTFFAYVQYAAGSGLSLSGLDSVAIGDMNGDGKKDLVVSDGYGYPNSRGVLSVLLGRGDGTFEAAVNYEAGYGGGSAAIGDINADGVLDLVVPGFYSNDVSVLIGRGDGTFQNAVRYDVGGGPKAVAIVDLNDDSIPDFAVVNGEENNISILFGLGDGSFNVGKEKYGVGSRPWAVAAGDFDGDGRPDLAVSNLGEAGYDSHVTLLITLLGTDPDADMDGLDLSRLIRDFGKCAGVTGTDLNADGCVNANDLALFAAVFGRELPTQMWLTNLYETFEGNSAENWTNDGSGTWVVANGVYQMDGLSTDELRYSYYNGVVRDFSFQAELRQTEGYLGSVGGLIFRGDGTYQNCYVFQITSNGMYLVFKRLNGQSVFLMSSWKESSDIIQGFNVWNTLRVDCADNQMKFYINDTLVETLTDNSFSSGKVGFRTYDYPEGNIMGFDNVQLIDRSLW